MAKTYTEEQVKAAIKHAKVKLLSDVKEANDTVRQLAEDVGIPYSEQHSSFVQKVSEVSASALSSYAISYLLEEKSFSEHK